VLGITGGGRYLFKPHHSFERRECLLQCVNLAQAHGREVGPAMIGNEPEKPRARSARGSGDKPARRQPGRQRARGCGARSSPPQAASQATRGNTTPTPVQIRGVRCPTVMPPDTLIARAERKRIRLSGSGQPDVRSPTE